MPERRRSDSANHVFQNETIRKNGLHENNILNIGCKEDPAYLGDDFGNAVTNLDNQDYDPAMQLDLTKCVKNFIKGDFLSNTFKGFRTYVFGEVFEHCTDEIILKMLRKAGNEGVTNLIITVPHDIRPKEIQYSRPEEFFEYAPGITSWHSNVITKKKIEDLLIESGFYIKEYKVAEWDRAWDLYWHLIHARLA